ncbi:MAG: hypothetical protein U1E05_05360, partial [Patescibacteria group bacterium]|nr:hypothetical protein [Patescibacteria group bacterium]
MNATIQDLPTSDYAVDANVTTEAVKEAFDSRPGLVGAIVVEDGRLLEVLSRDALFRHLSRAFFREIFLRRP